jgi:hypothetical protein
VPTREELGEGEWITAAAGTVINPVAFKPFNQIAEERLTQWDSVEGVEIIEGQDRAIQGAQNPTKFYVRVAERKLSPRFPHRMTKNFYVPIVSANRDI